MFGEGGRRGADKIDDCAVEDVGFRRIQVLELLSVEWKYFPGDVISSPSYIELLNIKKKKGTGWAALSRGLARAWLSTFL